MFAARMGRLRLAGMALVGCLALGLMGAGSALAETVTFKYTGAEQEFTVPAGVASVHVVATGGAGGKGEGGAAGGRAAVVSGDLSVTAGPLYVEVGGSAAGSTACAGDAECVAGFNGGGSSDFGGGGGGGSDVRTTSRSQPGTLESRRLVAAGGGGGGELCGPNPLPGGPGGDAEKPGGEGSNCGTQGGEGGGAGKETEGGAGGSLLGKPGSLGTGGEGGFGTGGGGGGGRYGGGGGGGITFEGAAGGGGGGSNLVPAGGTAALDENGAAPSVTITYTALPTSIKQCQKNGWKNYGTMFKNQGQCVKFVENSA
jgi:hypothetical protein